jgi:hypothetical protein
MCSSQFSWYGSCCPHARSNPVFLRVTSLILAGDRQKVPAKVSGTPAIISGHFFRANPLKASGITHDTVAGDTAELGLFRALIKIDIANSLHSNARHVPDRVAARIVTGAEINDVGWPGLETYLLCLSFCYKSPSPTTPSDILHSTRIAP